MNHPTCDTTRVSIRLILARAGLIALALAAWFFTQALLSERPFPEQGISDQLFIWTSSLNSYFLNSPDSANALLISSSLIIDILGIYLLSAAIFGKTLRPFLGLFAIFLLRQILQGNTALPMPEGMIWRNPGFPSLLVTYTTASDLFFSGHTAIAVYGALELSRRGGKIWPIIGLAIVIIEATTVILLRAHYLMDVYAGAITALWVNSWIGSVSCRVDRFIGLRASSR